MRNVALTIACLACWTWRGEAIVNRHQQTANIVIYLKRLDELSSDVWVTGVRCLDLGIDVFFQRRDQLTRSYNLAVMSSLNMSAPADQIQEGFLQMVNEAVSQRQDIYDHFQVRVISDAVPFDDRTLGENELLLADFYVLIVDTVERMVRLLKEYASRQKSWNPGARFLILYHNRDMRRRANEKAYQIFEIMLRQFYVHNIALLVATNASEYVMLVLDYFSNIACRSIRLREVGMCVNGVLQPNFGTVFKAVSDYLDAISLENCTFYMCASIAAPFVEEDCATGMELRIVAFMKNRLKFHINQTCEYESRGIMEDDGNWTGLLGKLNDRFCDFILGGYYPDNDVARSFWTSDCYLYDHHTWFVKLADQRRAWQALYSIFENGTWLCIALMSLVAWVCWYVIVNLLPEPAASKELSLAAINSLGVFISVSINERPHCHAMRLFFIALCIYGMNITSTYTSKLIAVFSNPGHMRQISNIQEVIDAGIPFGGPEENRDWFENNDDMWIFELYNDSSLFNPETENLMAVVRGERVILANRMYILQTNISDSMFAFSRNVFSSPLQIIMKSGFPFNREINRMIRHMRDAGFFRKIDHDFIYNNTYLNRISRMRPHFQKSVIVLTTEHLQGAFQILMAGIGASVLLFAGELSLNWLHCSRAGLGLQWSGTRAPSTRRNNVALKHAAAVRARHQKARKPQTQRVHSINKRIYDRSLSTYNLQTPFSVRFTPLSRRHVSLL